MRFLGFFLFILGIGSFVLPRYGLQYVFMNYVGYHQNKAALLIAFIGIFLIVSDIRKKPAL